MADASHNPNGDRQASGNWPPQRRLLWCVAGPLIVAFFLPSILNSLKPPEGRILDFFKEWAAVQNWRKGMPVYSKQSVALERHMGVRFDGRDGFLDEYNTHPPPAILVALPVAMLPYREAQFAWNLASLAMLAVSIVWIVKTLKLDFRPLCLLPLAALLVLCDPLMQSLIQGQPNLLLTLLIVAAWRFDQHGRALAAGAAIALAMAIKLYPGFLFLYFLMRRDWKALGSGAVAFVLITGVTAATFGVAAYRDYFETVLPSIQIVTNNWGNASLQAFWERLFGPSTPEIHSWHESSVMLAALVWASRIVLTILVARVCWKTDDLSSRSIAFALSTVVMLLLSPTTWTHYFVLLALPVGVLLSLSDVGSARRVIVNVLVVVLSIGPRPVWLWLIPAKPGVDTTTGIPWNDGKMTAQPWQSLTALSYQCYALLAMVLLLWLWRKTGRGTSSVLTASTETTPALTTLSSSEPGPHPKTQRVP